MDIKQTVNLNLITSHGFSFGINLFSVFQIDITCLRKKIACHILSG